MKKNLSVILFLTRKKIYKVTAVLAGMVLVSILGFRYFGFMEAASFGSKGGSLFLGCVCLLGYAGCIFSCVELPTKKSQMAYTYQRLLISERMVFAWDAILCILMFALLWGTEILIIQVLGKMYMAAPEYSQGPQGIVVALYRNLFLHGAVPLAERGIWIRNALFVVCSGLECACISVYGRYKSTKVSTEFLEFAIIALRFPVELGRETYILVILAVILAVIPTCWSIYHLHGGKKRRDEADAEE